MRSKYPNLENLPDDLKTDVEVIVREEFREIRGQRQKQYVARHGAYKLVVDEMASMHQNLCVEDGARVLVQPLSTPNGHIVFCKVQHVLADKNGRHPLIGMISWAFEYPHQIVVTGWRPTRTILDGYLRDLRVETKREEYSLGGRTSISIKNTLFITTDERTLAVEVGDRWTFGSGGMTTCRGFFRNDSVELSIQRRS